MKKGGIFELLCILWCFLLIPAFLLPEESIVGRIFLFIEAGLFILWLVWSLVKCFIVIFRDNTLSQLWEGFLDYIAETLDIIKVCLIIGLPLLIIAIAFYSSSDY